MVTSILSLFPTMFSILPNKKFNFLEAFILSSANAFNLVQSTIVSFGNELTISSFYDSEENSIQDSLKNIVGEGENAGTSNFSFPTTLFFFKSLSQKITTISAKFKMSVNAFQFGLSKILPFGKELTKNYTQFYYPQTELSVGQLIRREQSS